ncbi:sigma-70 family RNA polymerase sigma factor [Clostridium botulinum]|uniref:Sigma-70, region 4 family n=1 Tax=Clostridium botulinum (strain Eklund 17B / Type B) TaxID=935198 RepID=B2THF0_CLOBB|nr:MULTISPECIES: sigma factor-like helix-turn-helix DNA-binding protein [Clostridium]ACD22504.1 sigma-70, region 4 family [Clostridium botulinum B str. Eklund 17B (NRP)]MBY6977415.1 sigma-70 family RNA polymerase sigma factor [Clostridium botulinum]MBY7001970.1 sigma-70 family RNA polymerase sigma factor [Clostridium botulinum]MCR1275583.1 sigma-70 family RNA polymerase sigma factor [Clostridium botulinum]MCS6131406.1 sigma-70 family RNA polymerase sigma factor [Clostridium botulinum]
MEKDKIIESTKKLLENISVMKKRLENEVCEIMEEEKKRISSVLKVLDSLNEEEQCLVAYKYFENKTHSEIAERLHVGINTVTRKLKKLYLTIGRLLYGFEDEFLKELIEPIG